MADVNGAGLTAEELEFRDDAALVVLPAVLTKMEGEASSFDEIGALCAKVSYAIADAMLAARKGSGEV